ncbi:hypothetical protein H7142_00190 [Candidatus Saccharibacteria bacterium]|nr:hypothetical protein [Candidatus Saccharibacteria bacterium]
MPSLIRNSEKRFHKQLEKAEVRHAAALELGRVSLPIAEGKLAIMHSFGTTINSQYSPEDQKRIFKQEAEMVAASEFASQYADTQILPVANGMDMDFMLMDREVAGMVLVGHGTIAAFRMNEGKYYNWQNAERASKELKLGHFVQRTCGQFTVPQPVPLGTFVVADRRNCIAPVGIPIDDANPDESLFTAVYENEHVGAADILVLREKFYKPQAMEPSDEIATD